MGMNHSVPQKVVGIKRAISAAVGSRHTLVIQSLTVPNIPKTLFTTAFATGSATASEITHDGDILSTIHKSVDDVGEEATTNEVTEELNEENDLTNIEEERVDMLVSLPSLVSDDNTSTTATATATEDTSVSGNASLYWGCGLDADELLQDGLQPNKPLQASLATSNNILSLSQLCQLEICQRVDMRNVVDYLGLAGTLQCQDLLAFCYQFIEKYVVVDDDVVDVVIVFYCFLFDFVTSILIESYVLTICRNFDAVIVQTKIGVLVDAFDSITASNVEYAHDVYSNDPTTSKRPYSLMKSSTAYDDLVPISMEACHENATMKPKPNLRNSSTSSSFDFKVRK